MNTITVDHRYIVAADDALSFRNESAFLLAGSSSDEEVQLVNFGEVSVSGGGGRGTFAAVDATNSAPALVINKADATLVIAGGSNETLIGLRFAGEGRFNNDGLLQVKAGNAVGEAYGVYSSENEFLHLHNDGVMDVRAGGDANAVLCGGDSEVVNAGEIRATTSTGGQSAHAVIFNAAGSLLNTGSIEVSGDDGATAVTFRGSALTFNNAGVIQAYSNNGDDTGYGLIIAGVGDGRDYELVNSGLIRATDRDGLGYAIFVNPMDAGHFTLANSGRIVGNLYFSGGDDVVNNSGHMAGQLRLGDGDDRYKALGHGQITGEVFGGAGSDTLIGGRKADLLHGEDAVSGSDSGDKISGNGGDDALYGDAGADTLCGGAGADTLSGGADADVFLFAGVKDARGGAPDVITDLQSQDIINLSAIDADRRVDGDQAFRLVEQLDGHAGQAALTYDSGGDVTRLELDVNGDGRADAEIDLAGDQQGFNHFVL